MTAVLKLLLATLVAVCVSLSIIVQLILVIPFMFWRLFVVSTGSWFRSDLGAFIYSTRFVHADGSLPVTNNIVISFKVRNLVDVQKLKDRFVERCLQAKNQAKPTGQLLYPEFAQRITIYKGYPFWVNDPDFDVSNHFQAFEMDLMSESEWATKEQMILDEPFKKGGPSPWGFYIANDTKANMARIVFKFHLALGDGVSLYNALMQVADNHIPLQPPSGGSRRSWLSLLCSSPLIPPISFISEMLECYPFGPPFYPVKRDNSIGHSIKAPPLPKQQVKEIAIRHNVQFTAVVLSAITGALRAHMVRAKLKIPKSVFCILPVRVPNHKEGLTHQTAIVSVRLPVEIEDGRGRLDACEKALVAARTSKFPGYVAFQIFKSNLTPLPFRDLKPPEPIPVSVSFFPGPSVPLTLGGGVNLVEDIIFYSKTKSISCVSFTSFTYNGLLSMCMFSDEYVFQNEGNVAEVMEDLEKEYDWLSNSFPTSTV